MDRPGAEKIADLIRATYGNDESIGISRNACYTTSEHNDGRAVDWMVDSTTKAGRAKADSFLNWLLGTDKYGHKDAMARRLGVMYIIYHRHIWRAYDGGHWGDYTGTNPHTDHIHISLGYDGSTGRTSFWTGKPLASPCANGSLTTKRAKGRERPDALRAGRADPAGVDRVRRGMLSGPCRLFHGSGRRVDVQVTGTGPVPGRGVAAVALERLHAASQLGVVADCWARRWRDPRGSQSVGRSRTRSAPSSMVLPVGADGKVSFFSDFGATDLAVSVVGYYVNPDASRHVRRQIAADGGDEFDGVSPQRVAHADARTLRRSKVEVAGTAGTDPASSSATVSLTVASRGRSRLLSTRTRLGRDRPKLPVVTYGKKASTVQTLVPVGRGGSIVVENDGTSSRTINVDLSGAYEPAALEGGRSFALRKSPKQVVDTGSGLGFSNLGDGASKTFRLGDSVPRHTDSVLLQVTAKKAKSAGALTFWQPGTTRPDTVDLSVQAPATWSPGRWSHWSVMVARSR